MSNSDQETHEDEEEILVYVKFEGVAENEQLKSENLKLNMLGVDTEHPIMQINGKCYEGTYEDAVGTYMFFDKNDNREQVDDPFCENTASKKYYCKTRKILRMRRIFSTPRTEFLEDKDDPLCLPNPEPIKAAGVPVKYQEAALANWVELRNRRAAAKEAYLEKQKLKAEKGSKGLDPDSESDDAECLAFLNDTRPEDHGEDNMDLSQLESLIDEMDQDQEPIPSTSKETFPRKKHFQVVRPKRGKTTKSTKKKVKKKVSTETEESDGNEEAELNNGTGKSSQQKDTTSDEDDSTLANRTKGETNLQGSSSDKTNCNDGSIKG